jgi:hypothetical protein
VTDIDLTPQQVAVARTLAAEIAGAEVIAAWRARGIEPILLKGATLSSWLYPDATRTYGDTDLLVAPQHLCSAAEILSQLGFVPVSYHVSLHSHPWIREADAAAIDLHVNLWGPGRPADRVWAELQNWVEQTSLAGTPVRTLNLPARALYVTLHAAQHHEEGGKPLDDLRRALELTPASVWSDSEQLADRLGVLGFMARGLTLQPGGEDVIARLPLVRACLLAEREAAPLAIGFERFAQARGLRAKVMVMLRSLTRPPDEYGPDRPAEPTRGLNPVARIRHFAYLIASAGRTFAVLRRSRRSR